MGAPRIMEVRHFASVAAIEPFGQVLQLIKIARCTMNWGNAAQIKPMARA